MMETCSYCRQTPGVRTNQFFFPEAELTIQVSIVEEDTVLCPRCLISLILGLPEAPPLPGEVRGIGHCRFCNEIIAWQPVSLGGDPYWVHLTGDNSGQTRCHHVARAEPRI